VPRRAASAVVQAVEPFHPAFGIYLEDHDFGLRVRMAGGALLARAASPFARGLARTAPERAAQSLIERRLRAYRAVVSRFI